MVSAANQLSPRSMTLSDSSPSGGTVTSGVGSGTNVAYSLAFTVGTASNVGGVVIDFCTTTPLPFDACTAPTGFNTNFSTVTIAAQSGTGGSNFAIDTSNSTASKLVLTRGTAATPSGTTTLQFGNGTTTGMTNPTSTGTIYARVYTYGTGAQAQGHSQTVSNNNVVDFGGVAIAIANVITITARVQETLIFCVSAADPGSNCTGTTVPAITLGHGSGVKYIDSSQVDTGTVYTQLSTNASTGATIRMRSGALTGGLDNGSNSIPPVGAGAATPSAMSAGTAAFGVYVANGSGGQGTVSANANYNNGNSSNYGMDTTTSGTNVTTVFGDPIAASTAPVSNVENTLTFAATASNLTPAGRYQANLSLIATGQY